MAALAALPAVFQGISAVASLASGVVGAAGAMQQAKAQQAALKYQNQQLEIREKNRRAQAFMEKREEERKRDLTLSTLQARSAASGFMATDPTTLQLGEQITKRGTYFGDIRKFQGLDEAAGIEGQIASNRITSQAIGTGATYSALGSLLKGATGFASYASGINFGGGGGATGAPFDPAAALRYG